MNGKEVIRKLKAAGWVPMKNRGKGSHTMFYHPEKPGCYTVVQHGELAPKTVRSIEKATGIKL